MCSGPNIPYERRHPGNKSTSEASLWWDPRLNLIMRNDIDKCGPHRDGTKTRRFSLEVYEIDFCFPLHAAEKRGREAWLMRCAFSGDIDECELFRCRRETLECASCSEGQFVCDMDVVSLRALMAGLKGVSMGDYILFVYIGLADS